MQKPSKSAEAARRHELERVAAMSPRERVILALSLGGVATLLRAWSSRSRSGNEAQEEDDAKDRLAEQTMTTAEQVVSLLAHQGVPTVVIGAAAMAAHGSPRLGGSIDLAIHMDHVALNAVMKSLRRAGFDAHWCEPDGDDPLGGVMTIVGGDLVPIQVVNFHNPWSQGCGTMAAEAISNAERVAGPKSPLCVVGLPYLIALKLYAGGYKSEADVAELLERNREHLDLAGLRDVCNRHGLGAALEPLLTELGFA